MAYDLKSMVNKAVKSGMKPKMAIAAGLAKKRKYAMGGEVEADDDSEVGQPTYPMGTDEEGLSESVMEEQELAKHLQSDRYAANDNTHDFEADHPTMGSKMREGGVAQPEQANIEVGNKPDLDWIDEGTEEPMDSMPSKPAAMARDSMNMEPMGMGLSDEAKAALKAKKMKRRFMA